MSEIMLPPCVQELTKTTLPDPDEISIHLLQQKRKIYMDYDVDETLTSIHRLLLLWNMEDKGKPKEEREPIWLYIMSYGGNLDDMQMLLSAIEASTTPVYTVNIGSAHSAASLIFISGHKRFMAKNAKIIIHEGSAVIGGDAQKVQDQAESYKKAVQWMKDYILSHTNIPKKDLMKRRTHDWEIDAEYCLNYGVCHTVITSLDEVI